VNLDLSVYLVIGAQSVGARGVIATVNAAVRGGVGAVQLRDKRASGRELVSIAGQLLDALDGTGVPLLINDRLDVALAAGANGVHLGHADVGAQSARRLAGPDFLVGLSVSSAEELAEVDALPPGTVDYLGIGPVFPTSTKSDAAAALGLDTVATLRGRTKLPCVGIGGINRHNAPSVWAAGLDGLAVVSAICDDADPRAVALALRNTRP